MQTPPIFKTPAGDDIDRMLAFCARGIAGAEAYTFLTLERKDVPPGRLFFAAENGRIFSVVFNNGDRNVTTQAGVFPYPGLCLLRYAGGNAPALPVLPAGLPETAAFYRQMGGGRLTPDNETRYVYRARALRDGLAKGFCVKTDGAPVSFAYIVAGNMDSCLLGDVFTVPEMRGRGYGTAAVLAAANAALQNGQTPYALCEPGTAGFYGRMGFVRWTGPAD